MLQRKNKALQMGLGEGVKVWKDLLGMWLFVWDADGGLVTELGLWSRK